MSSASWTPESNGNSAKWSENKVLADLQSAASLYNTATITYSSSTNYYNGYNPTGTTPEGENPASWTPESNGASSTWVKVAE